MDLLTRRDEDECTEDEWSRLAAEVASLLTSSGEPLTLAWLKRHLGTSDPVILHNVLITLEFDFPRLFDS